MIIKREQINSLMDAIATLKEDNTISLSNKYYLIKIFQSLTEEAKIAYDLFEELSSKYGEQTEKGIQIKEEYIENVAHQIEEFNKTDITLPDYKFSIDAFQNSNLSWSQVEALMPFIK